MIHIDIKKLGRFDRIGHRITGDRTGQSNDRTSRKGAPAGSSCTPTLTIPPASPSAISCPTRKRHIVICLNIFRFIFCIFSEYAQ